MYTLEFNEKQQAWHSYGKGETPPVIEGWEKVISCTEEIYLYYIQDCVYKLRSGEKLTFDNIKKYIEEHLLHKKESKTPLDFNPEMIKLHL